MIAKTVLMAAVAMAAVPAAAAPAAPLALGQATPRGACGYPADCGFKREAVSYASFDKSISRREICAPASRLFEVARAGDRLETVTQRLRRQGRVHVIGRKHADGWLLTAGSRTDEFMSIEVTFDSRGHVKCVTEMLLTV
jgi:hypothetical protein